MTIPKRERRELLLDLKSKLRDEIIVIEQVLGIIEARTIAIPLAGAVDAVDVLLKKGGEA